MEEHGFSYEIIFINDGSTDDSWRIIQELREKNPHVRGVKFRRNYGKSPGLQCGFARTRGDVVITMDADLQDSPDEIPGLYHMVKEEGYDLVSGWKQKRYDPVLSKNLPSKLFNATARKLSGIDNLHDFNCGLKAYRSEVVKSIEIYNDMHRYIPYMAKVAGFSRIGEKVVQHQARKYGTSKFGLNRFVNGYLDLITLWFTSTFGRKPMHFFGLGGSLMFIIGFLALAVVLCSKLFHIWTGTPAPLVTDRPYFFIALTAMVIGTQLFLSGFVAELLARQSQDRNDYKIDEEI
jgi:putative glycosyltransferase